MHRFHEEHGPDWATLAKILGKHRFHVKDTWRRVKLPAAKKGMLISCSFLSSFTFQNFLDTPRKIYNYVCLHKFHNHICYPQPPGFLSSYSDIYIHTYIYIHVVKVESIFSAKDMITLLSQNYQLYMAMCNFIFFWEFIHKDQFIFML